MAKVFSRKPLKKPAADRQIVVGLNPVLAALKARGHKALDLWVADSRQSSPALSEILALAEAHGLTARRPPRAELDRLAAVPHQGVAAFFPPIKPLPFAEAKASLKEPGPALLLALDHLEDPHNLGALWRTAAAFGVKGLIAPKDRAAPSSAVAYKVAAGGAEVTPLYEAVNLARALEELKELGFWLVGAEGGQGQSLWEFSFPGRAVLALGSEGRGLSRLVREKMDFLVHVPLAGPIDSLNVSAAGAILMAAYFKEKSP